MPNDPTHSVLRYLHGVLREDPPEATDQALLDRFVRARDQSAFTVLLHRHGPLVWRVCRRVLRQHQDAEDAFQATFIVLARKAASLRDPRRLSCWLHGVASRVASKARSRYLRRPVSETLTEEPSVFDAPHLLEWQEVAGVLDEEIARLPEKLRLPFVLCYLMEETNEEAARRIGCPKGTVLSRLSTARQRLRQRLVRRGLVLSAATLAALAGQSGSASEPPSGLVSSTAQLAVRPADVVGAVAVLVQGVLLSMTLIKLSTLALVITLGVLLAAGGFLISQASDDRPNPEKEEKPLSVAQKPPDGGPNATLAQDWAAKSEDTRKELERLHTELDKMEDQWADERLQLRRQLTEKEESARTLERDAQFQRDRIKAAIQNESARCREVEKHILALELQVVENQIVIPKDKLAEHNEKMDKLDQQIKAFQTKKKEWQKSLHNMEDQAREMEMKYHDQFIRLSLQQFEEQNLFSVLDRKQHSARARMQTKIERMEEQLRQIESGGSREATLEKKLDRLLKEISELRQELKRPSNPTPR